MRKDKILLLLVIVLPLFSFAQSQKDIGSSFIDKLFQKQYIDASTYFADSLKTQINPETLRQAEEGITQQVGKYVSNLDINEEDGSGYKIIYYYSKFENQNLDIKISFNQANKIVGFFVVPHKEFDKKKQ